MIKQPWKRSFCSKERFASVSALRDDDDENWIGIAKKIVDKEKKKQENCFPWNSSHTCSPSHIITLSLSLTHTLPLRHTHTHTWNTQYHSFFLSSMAQNTDIHTHTNYQKLTLSLPRTNTQTTIPLSLPSHSLRATLSHPRTLLLHTLTLTPSFNFTPTLSHKLIMSHTFTQTHTLCH